VSIAKIKTNDSARATLQYAVGKPGARVIGGNAVPWVERNELSTEELQQVVAIATRKLLVSIDLSERIKRGVGHTSISFRPEEQLDDEQLSDYCEKYLSGMILSAEQPELLKPFDAAQFRAAVEAFRAQELSKYSYTIVRHTDEPHPHAHLVYSRVNLETGTAVSNSFERYRSQEILRDLERQYQLESVPNSWEVGRKAQSISQLQKESETGQISIQKRLQDILEPCGETSRTVLQFIQKAQEQGVEVRMAFTRTGKSKGISYGLDGVALSGNALGTRYSFKHSDPGLCRAFNLEYEPERDNAQIQVLCQQKPLTPEQRELTALRNHLTASLNDTAAAIQPLDFNPPTATGTTNAIGTPGHRSERRDEVQTNREPDDLPLTAAGDAEPAATGRAGDARISRSFEPPHLPGRRRDSDPPEPEREQIFNRSTGATDSATGANLQRLDQSLRDLKFNSGLQIQRINEQLTDLDQHLKERRAERLRQLQTQREWAQEIARIAEQLFEYRAAKGRPPIQTPSFSTERIYRVQVANISYQLSRDEVTGAYNVRREDTQLNLQTRQNLTQEDVQNWRMVRLWLEQQEVEAEPPPPEPVVPVPLTLEDCCNLTIETWKDLAPKQQIPLVHAMQNHERTQPTVTVQVEQWVGQEAQLKGQLQELRELSLREQKALQQLEERGQRSLFNPFGATAEELQEAREQLRITKQALTARRGEYDRMQERRQSRQQQEKAQQAWLALPATQGAQRLSELLQQPEVSAQYEQVCRLVGQLHQWVQVARSVGRTEAQIKEIHQVHQAYVEGRSIPPVMLDRMARDLKQYHLQQRSQSRGLEYE
jgi:hypothetical protein